MQVCLLLSKCRHLGHGI